MKRSEHFFEATKEGFGRSDAADVRTGPEPRYKSPEPRAQREPRASPAEPRSQIPSERPKAKSQINRIFKYVQMTLKLCFVNLASGIGTSYVQDDANQKIESKQVFRRACFIRHLKRTHPTLQTRFVRPRRS